MTGTVRISLLLLLGNVIWLSSCNSQVPDSDVINQAGLVLDSIENYTELPSSTLSESEAFVFDSDTILISHSSPIRRGSSCFGSVEFYEHNYAFKSSVNGGEQRLMVHRTMLKDDAEYQLLGDVNFFINHLNSLTKNLLTNYPDRFEEDEIGNLGTMYFCDSVELDEEICDSVIYHYWYSYFSGGGKSLSDKKTVRLSILEFEEWCNSPMSSDKLEKLGVILEE